MSGQSLGDLHVVALAFDGAFRGEQSDVVVTCEVSDDLGGGPDDAEHAPVGVPLWEVVLLDGAQGLSGGRVASDDDEMASHLEEFLYGLPCELIDDVERSWSVGRACVVAEVEVVVLWQQLANAMQDGKATVTAVEDADGPWGCRQR